MRVKRTVWIFSMIMLVAALFLIVNSRVQLTGEVILGGYDDVFLKTDNLKNPLDDYQNKDDADKVTAPDGLDYPNIDITRWQYMLVTPSNSIGTYAPDTIQVGTTSVRFDENAASSLRSLIQAAKDAGYTMHIGDSFVSYSQQQKIFNDKATQLAEQGDYSFDEATELAKEIVAYPGCCEHQTGLAVDLFDQQYTVYDYMKMNAEFYEWLDENCAKYGFIKRYPTEKADITGYDEPWHYRYVGTQAATFIMENGLCFEEFCAHYR